MGKFIPLAVFVVLAWLIFFTRLKVLNLKVWKIFAD
jgi:hypothetical protein